jgi:hypothetical protein
VITTKFDVDVGNVDEHSVNDELPLMFVSVIVPVLHGLYVNG